MANAWRSSSEKTYSPKDFMPQLGEAEEQEPVSLTDKINAAFRAFQKPPQQQRPQ